MLLPPPSIPPEIPFALYMEFKNVRPLYWYGQPYHRTPFPRTEIQPNVTKHVFPLPPPLQQTSLYSSSHEATVLPSDQIRLPLNILAPSCV